MEYAVIQSGGKQYVVKKGDLLTLDKLPFKKEEEVTFKEVPLLVSNGKVMVGRPHVSGARVKAIVVEEKKGEKLYVRKFKAKSRHRRTVGFRPHLTTLRIEQIVAK